jgi:hypothetical protein
MTIRDLVFISLLISPMMGQSQKMKGDSVKTSAEYVIVEDIVEEPTIPMHIKSKFKTLQDWLYNICDNDEPKKSIQKFNINIIHSEPSGDYAICLWGVNTYNEGKNRSVTRIDFTPTNMYFKIPKKEYKNLTQEQLKLELTSQLKDFAKSEKFRNSYLTKANAIIMEFSGESIWTK